MAVIKISDLTALSTPATDDVIPIVDTSAVETKKITIANLGLMGLTTWTPTITQNVSITITINYAKYVLIGNVCFAWTNITIGSAGTTNNYIVLGGLPKTPAYGTNTVIGSFQYLDQGVAYYTGTVFSSTVIYFMIDAAGDGFGKNPNFAVANADHFSALFMYPFTS